LLTDAFFRRYEDVTLWLEFAEQHRRLLGQAAQLIADDMFVRNERRYKEAKNDPAMKSQEVVHSKLARELGLAYLIAPTFTRSWKASNGNTVSRNFTRTLGDKTKLR
jgi:hypothetical protein